MIKTNAAGRKLYNKLRTVDGVILARNVLYPNITDDSPIAGDDGSVKFLAIDEDPVPIPGTDYDERYFLITSTEGPVDGWKTDQHPIYRIVKTPTKRPVDEIKAQASNQEVFIRNLLAPPASVNGDIAIIVTALARQTKGIQLTDAEQQALDRQTKLSAVFLANKANLDTIHTAIEAGHEPDLTAGYQTEIAP